MRFSKPPKTIVEQIELLRSRGMRIDDETSAAHYLSHLNYYRLSGYWLPFEASRNPHRFHPGVSFEDVLNLYIFDRELRLLVLDAIERIEVSLRTQWAYHLAQHAGAHAHLEHRFSSSARKHAEQLARLAAETQRSQELFVAHYRKTYTEPDMPPIWAASEVLSLGQLSRWYELLRPISLRSKIAKTYGLDQQVMESVLHHLTYIRNLCAHHSRLWNRELTVTVALPRTKPRTLAQTVDRRNTRKLYNALAVILHLMNVIAPNHQWRTRLMELLHQHRITATDMGFPPGWETLPLWTEEAP